MDDWWVDEWNNAVQCIPRPGAALPNSERRLVLRHLLKIDAATLSSFQNKQVVPDERVMRLTRIIGGPDGRVWMKVWLRDFEGAAFLLWPDGTLVYETFRRET